MHADHGDVSKMSHLHTKCSIVSCTIRTMAGLVVRIQVHKVAGSSQHLYRV
jgi:hypothetical protein